MKNPHMVVDPATRRCLCGNYSGVPRTCADILKLADKYSDGLHEVFSTLLVDCSEPFSQPPKDELAWLVERDSPAKYAYMDDMGIQWTDDPNKAMRFARRDDAEMFAAGSDDVVRICEHMWCSPPTTANTDRGDQT